MEYNGSSTVLVPLNVPINAQSQCDITLVAVPRISIVNFHWWLILLSYSYTFAFFCSLVNFYWFSLAVIVSWIQRGLRTVDHRIAWLSKIGFFLVFWLHQLIKYIKMGHLFTARFSDFLNCMLHLLVLVELKNLWRVSIKCVTLVVKGLLTVKQSIQNGIQAACHGGWKWAFPAWRT